MIAMSERKMVIKIQKIQIEKKMFVKTGEIEIYFKKLNSKLLYVLNCFML